MKNPSEKYLLPLFCLLVFALAVDSRADVFNMVLENDAFANTDHHYTSGLLLNYVNDREELSSPVRQFAVHLPAIDDSDQIFTGFYLGQQIFTPDDIDTSDLLVNERPYAGYLFGGLALMAANSRQLDTWRVSIGVVGPKSYGQRFQSSIHNRLGVNQAQGWENQLGNETIFQSDYHRTWRELWNYAGDGFGADLMPYVGFALGNAAVNADAGVTLRVGQGLGNDYGPPRMKPGLSGSSFFGHGNSNPGWYVFFGLGGRYVAHNIFLDGNNNQTSHRVEKHSWVGDIQTGFVMNSRSYRLAWTFVGRSREYRSQEVGDHFGSLTFSLKF